MAAASVRAYAPGVVGLHPRQGARARLFRAAGHAHAGADRDLGARVEHGVERRVRLAALAHAMVGRPRTRASPRRRRAPALFNSAAAVARARATGCLPRAPRVARRSRGSVAVPSAVMALVLARRASPARGLVRDELARARRHARALVGGGAAVYFAACYLVWACVRARCARAQLDGVTVDAALIGRFASLPVRPGGAARRRDRRFRRPAHRSRGDSRARAKREADAAGRRIARVHVRAHAEGVLLADQPRRRGSRVFASASSVSTRSASTSCSAPSFGAIRDLRARSLHRRAARRPARCASTSSSATIFGSARIAAGTLAELRARGRAARLRGHRGRARVLAAASA